MNQPRKKAVAMLRRELQEYKNSFVVTPLAVAGVLLACMLVSVLLANRISVAGDSIIEILSEEHTRSGMNITISIDESSSSQDYVISQELEEENADPDDWNFSREWTFNPEAREKATEESPQTTSSLNPVLYALHCLFLVLLLVTSINYLLGTFHQDRRDGSVLFWKSLPVSEGQEIAVKMATVSIVAPVIYLAVSMLIQLASVALAMVITWRMDMNPIDTVLGNVGFWSLFRGQLSGMLIWVAWTAPFYAWLLLCSSAARRSPLMLALAIPISLIVLEELFLGSEYLADAFSNHIPHIFLDDGSSVGTSLGFYFGEPEWLSLDYLGMLLGLVVAAALLFGAAWFRKHRFEL